MTSETEPKEAPTEVKATSTEVKVDLFEDDDEFEEFDIDIGIFNNDGFVFFSFICSIGLLSSFINFKIHIIVIHLWQTTLLLPTNTKTLRCCITWMHCFFLIS